MEHKSLNEAAAHVVQKQEELKSSNVVRENNKQTNKPESKSESEPE